MCRSIEVERASADFGASRVSAEMVKRASHELSKRASFGDCRASYDFMAGRASVDSLNLKPAVDFMASSLFASTAAPPVVPEEEVLNLKPAVDFMASSLFTPTAAAPVVPEEEEREVRFVIPSKALAFDEDGAIQRATAEDSLSETYGADFRSRFTYVGYGAAGFALPKGLESSVSTSEERTVVMFGRLSNVDYLLKKHDLPEDFTDAAIVSHLYSTKKYKFLPSLRGEYSFILLSRACETPWCFAVCDKSGRYPLYQGADATGGLVVSNEKHDGFSLIEPATFIAGMYRDRQLHQFQSTDNQFKESATVAAMAAQQALRSVSNTSTSSKSSPSPGSSPASQAAARALAGLNLRRSPTPSASSASSPASSPASSSASLSPAAKVFTPSRVVAARVNTTPSKKGTADRAMTWKVKSPQSTPTKQLSDISNNWRRA